MTKRKLVSSARKTTTKWKLFPPPIASHVTGVVESTSSEKEKLKNHGLRALNDIVIIKEESIDFEVDTPSGLSKEVVASVRSGKLVIPESAEYYAKKYPCVGEVIAVGEKVKISISIGDRVLFERHGGVREQVDGRDYVFIRGAGIHCVLS